jgi:hypothetical protein
MPIFYFFYFLISFFIMSQQFKTINVSTGERNKFDLSHNQVTTTDFGKIIPIMVRECLPNDDFYVDPKVFIRLGNMPAPTFGKIKCRLHTFFVPNRIMWNRWDDFIVGSYTGSAPYVTIQQIHAALSYDPASDVYPGTTSPNDYQRGEILDTLSNLGFNPKVIHKLNQLEPAQRINAFPFLAYQRIWFDYFRDSNLSQVGETWFNAFVNGGSLDAYVNQILRLRHSCYKKDYFTTAKVNPQEGGTGSYIRVSLDSSSVYNPSDRAVIYAGTDGKLVTSNGSDYVNTTLTGGSVYINGIRAANARQRYLERNNFVGERTISRLQAHFGVAPSAERLDMAEWLGSNEFDVKIQDVTSTSMYNGSSPTVMADGLGALAGKGWLDSSQQKSNPVKYHCTEHGIMMTVMSILPDTGYYQGLSKMWQRGFMGDGPIEYFTPEYENLGYEPILNRQVYVPGQAVTYSNYASQGIFGYTPRYSDYKFQLDVLAGDMVAADTEASADCYHLFRKMDFSDTNPLQLNEDFVVLNNQNNDYDRIYKVTDNKIDHFICDISVNCVATRNMSSFAEPMLDANEEERGQRVTLPYGGIRL